MTLTDQDFLNAASLIGCDPKVIKAVTKVESSGSGFDPSGRCIIRFENHKFYQFWGKDHSADYAMHFKFTRSQPWLGHLVLLPPGGMWQGVHTGNAQEWRVFEYAESLDEAAAKKSISMGLFQLMGFNYQLAGYASVQDFFNDQVKSEALQLEAFSRFCKNYNNLATYLTKKDWKNFAARYNGSGNVDDYAKKLEKAYESL